MSNPDIKPEAPESATNEQPANERPGRKFLLDLGPLVLFFATNYATGDFMLAVKVLVGATLAALAAGWVLERRVSMMALVGCVAVAFFGGLSVWFDNDLFIKIKPTVLTCLLAAIIAGGRLIGRNPLGAIIGTQLRMSEAGWRAISWIWVVMFLTTALANEIAWRTLSTDDWVTFKVFGLTAISLVFTVISVPVMTKHQIED
ncbi:MAG: inner membrane-spanning protein YciB [Pseudomonadota bacterium]|nr:inner membrane-spanning protein YciB [Pseudomonadota bacterium]MEC7305371.1 inner membrane-spanning protein YciB [Pseudomonadota bacterium]MEC8130602.1 inner membrane-spanning protein YciB [Pseudomonadota bacterium]